jgi:hypothetical protein
LPEKKSQFWDNNVIAESEAFSDDYMREREQPFLENRNEA